MASPAKKGGHVKCAAGALCSAPAHANLSESMHFCSVCSRPPSSNNQLWPLRQRIASRRGVVGVGVGVGVGDGVGVGCSGGGGRGQHEDDGDDDDAMTTL